MEHLHYLLMKAQAMFSRKVLWEAGKLGLTPGQPKILDFLLQYKEADQKTIAAYCEIEQTTVGSILLRMENAGLVQRRQKDGNRRSLYVSLTQSGIQAAEQMMDIFQTVEMEAVADLSPEEEEALCRLLNRICGNLQSASEKKKV